MSAKKVAFGARPQLKEQQPADPDAWVENRTKPEENMRMTFDVPKSLHRRVKAGCALQGVTIREKLLELLEREFPAER
ncbi:MAG TPA: hypothetical protein VEZ12_15505 [Herpetosiphonaceae bacterium]|jgi:hypothetical protein|nr:hypothetical protein [Herpetosiphonaceae bacterium]